MKVIYRADDRKEFETETECLAYERELYSNISDAMETVASFCVTTECDKCPFKDYKCLKEIYEDWDRSPFKNDTECLDEIYEEWEN